MLPKKKSGRHHTCRYYKFVYKTKHTHPNPQKPPPPPPKKTKKPPENKKDKHTGKPCKQGIFNIDTFFQIHAVCRKSNNKNELHIRHVQYTR